MISRDLANLQHVHAFNGPTSVAKLLPFFACTDTDPASFTCIDSGVLSTAALGDLGFGGRIIDRLGLRQNYNAVIPLVDAWAEVYASSTVIKNRYLAVNVGLQHSSSTCSADFANLSTDLWKGRRPLTLITNTTVSCSAFWSCTNTDAFDLQSTVQSGLLTTVNTTSTGYAVLISGPETVFSLGAAKRYLRMVVAPVSMATGSDTGTGLHVVGSLLFGEADQGPAETTLRGRTVVTCNITT